MREYGRVLKDASRELRKNMTEAEQRLWSHLRGKQLLGVQFYRQKPIGPYIVDFFAPGAGLVVEADGSQHREPENARRDEERDRFLVGEELRVLRFDNYQILRDTDAVIQRIIDAIQEGLRNPP
ncbi:endonuclease domain-containing protein [Geotalea uraniireducens]|nr:endonuclease domain-containing protein [Geotalea uraniireducens]